MAKTKSIYKNLKLKTQKLISKKMKGDGFAYRKFKVKAREYTKETGIKITDSELKELFFDIDGKSKIIDSLIKASKEGIKISIKDAKKIYIARKKEDAKFSKILESYIAIKKHEINLTIDDFIKMYSGNRNISKITKALIKAKKGDVNLTINDIDTMFYAENENEKLLEEYFSAKKEMPSLTTIQIRTAFLKGINRKKLIGILRMIRNENLQIPFPIILNLAGEKVNSIKAIQILSKAKKSSLMEISALNIFNKTICDKLSNTYVIEGEDKFRKALSDEIIETDELIDPDELLSKLIKSKSKGFKISLETIKDYINFHTNINIDKITESFLKAKINDINLTYKQIVSLAQKEVDVVEFVNAEIKSYEND